MQATDLYLYLAQSFTYSLVAVIAAYPLIKIWRISDPRLRFNFHLLTLLLPMVLPALFYLAYPGRHGLHFRDRLALLDLRQWLDLSLGKQFTFEHLLLVMFGGATVLFIFQEVLPLVSRRSYRKSNLYEVEPGCFPLLEEALAESSKLMSHPLPPVRISDSPGMELHIQGVFSPTLVLSPRAAASANKEELTAILCHEMAHLVRKDQLSGWALVILRSLAFYNPVAWFTSRLMWQENERICDRMSARATGNPLALANALVTTVEQTGRATPRSAHSSAPSPEPNSTNVVNSHLATRVRSLVEHDVVGAEWGTARLWTFGVLLTALLFFIT